MGINSKNALIIPVVALRGLVVFPGMLLHFDVGREKSIAALKAVMDGNREVFLVAQKRVADEDPGAEDLYKVGVVATVKQVLKLPGNSGNIRVAVEGLYRAKLDSLISKAPYLTGGVTRFTDAKVSAFNEEYATALVRRAKEIFDEYATLVPHLPDELVVTVMDEKKPGRLADYIAGNVVLGYADRQQVLKLINPLKRLESLCVILTREITLLSLESDIQERVQNQIDRNQREYYLREQMKAINIELNNGNAAEDEIQAYREKIVTLGLGEEDEKKLLRECDRLERSSMQSPEGAVIRNYIETCIALPWNKLSKEKLNLARARKILDEDHYGMEVVKRRMVESLAVRVLAPEIKGQIICLVGPPGVGKTSVAKSVARALGRKYVRISLGGVRDEAEIRGHRKTYIGSMPGRIISAIQQAGTANPLILLDEVDKLGNDYKGDPSSALLEVLDGEQNNSFRDHYLEIPFDLSRVLFLTTANVYQNIPEPLRDRMEIIELSSYTHEEKFNIAKKHLLKKQIKKHGLSPKQIRLSDDALHFIIDGYTREAGVRRLEQLLASVCRKAAVQIADGTPKVTINEADIEGMLGARKHKKEHALREDEAGVVNGLAWTSVGGELLEIEAAILEGTGKQVLTGSLGDVMKESAKAAVSCIRSRADKLKIDPGFYKDKDIHIHVPQGAVPKDGPSAGITIATALVSALTGTRVKSNVAMTGEITLRGRVLPIGGLKEKLMAAYRSGITTAIIPAENVPDMDEVDEVVKSAITVVPVSHFEQVLETALIKNGELKENGIEAIIPPEAAENRRPSITQ